MTIDVKKCIDLTVQRANNAAEYIAEGDYYLANFWLRKAHGAILDVNDLMYQGLTLPDALKTPYEEVKAELKRLTELSREHETY